MQSESISPRSRALCVHRQVLVSDQLEYNVALKKKLSYMFSRVSLLIEFVHALYRITRLLNGRSSTARRFRMIASTIRVITSVLLASSECLCHGRSYRHPFDSLSCIKAGFLRYLPPLKKSAVQKLPLSKCQFCTVDNTTRIKQ